MESFIPTAARDCWSPDGQLPSNTPTLDPTYPFSWGEDGKADGVGYSQMEWTTAGSGENDEPLSRSQDDMSEESVAISTSFYQGGHSLESDLIVRSSDSVLFYVHKKIISDASPRALPSFMRLVMGQQEDVFYVPETSPILNIILHGIYKTSCTDNAPSAEQLIEAVDKMPKYGLNPSSVISSNSPLHNLLLSHGALRPLKVYALAAHHNLEPLAKHVSTYLLGHYAEEIDDETAERIGPIYLKRFFALSVTRMRQIAQILIQPPERHPFKDTCGYQEQKQVTREWSLSLIDLIRELKPDIPIHRIQSTLEPLADKLSCTDCQNMVKKRVREIVLKCAEVKHTI